MARRLAIALILGSAAFTFATSALLAADAAAPAVSFTLPENWSAKTDGADIVITPRKGFNEIHVRSSDAKAPADAVDGIAKAIVADVKDFKTTKVNDVKIAGKDAKHVIGTGTEADDGDPSNSEVFIFVVGEKVYTACVHGEGIDAEKIRPEVIKVLDTAKAK